MNMKKIFRNILLSALTITAVASCADDRNNFLPDDSFGFNIQAGNNVVTLPIYGGSYDISVIKSGKGLNEGTVTVTTSNADLLAFNKANNVEYIPLPKDQELYSFDVESISFGENDVTKSFKVSWDVAKVAEYMAQEAANQYAIPVALRSDDLVVNDGREVFIINLVTSTVNAEQTLISRTYEWESEPASETANITVRIDKSIPTHDLTVNFAVDEKLVAAYNEANGTNYELAPEGLVTLGANPVIKAGEGYSLLPVTINTDALAEEVEVEVDGATVTKRLVKRNWDGYVVPIVLTGLTIDGVAINNALTYVVIKGVAPVPPALFSRLWGYYSDGAAKIPWFLNNGMNIEGLVGTTFVGNDRSFTIDDTNLYLTQSSDVPAVHKFDLFTGEYKGSLDVTGMAGCGSTHPTSCPRMIPNTNPDINGGKDVLVVAGLAAVANGSDLTMFAYLDGVDAAPTKIYDLAAARRFGDKVSFSGVWGNGYFWLRSNQSGDALVANIGFGVQEKNVAGVNHWIDPYRINVVDYEVMSEVYWTPQTDNTIPSYCLIGTNSDKGLHLMSGIAGAGTGSELASYPNLACTFGWNFFEYNGRKFMAFVNILDKFHPSVQVIEGDYTTLEGLKAALDAYSQETVFFSAPIQDPMDATVDGHADVVIGDCCVRKIGNDIYMAAGTNVAGISVFKFNPGFLVE